MGDRVGVVSVTGAAGVALLAVRVRVEGLLVGSGY